jgi:hypothetical protein
VCGGVCGAVLGACVGALWGLLWWRVWGLVWGLVGCVVFGGLCGGLCVGTLVGDMLTGPGACTSVMPTVFRAFSYHLPDRYAPSYMVSCVNDLPGPRRQAWAQG